MSVGYQARGRNRDYAREERDRLRREVVRREQMEVRAASEAVIAALPPMAADPHFPRTFLDVMSEDS